MQNKFAIGTKVRMMYSAPEKFSDYPGWATSMNATLGKTAIIMEHYTGFNIVPTNKLCFDDPSLSLFNFDSAQLYVFADSWLIEIKDEIRVRSYRRPKIEL